MVIPVHDVNPVRRTPWVTHLLVLANLAVFLLTPASSAVSTGASLAQTCEQQAFYVRWGAVPDELTHNRQLTAVPSRDVVASPSGGRCKVEAPRYRKSPPLSALTSLFLHASWLHLLGNMLFLWIFGNNIEDRFGRLRFLLFYLGCGVLAAYGFAFAGPTSTQPLIGASGAIAGVLGAYLVLYPKARVWSLVPFLFFIPLRLPAWFVLGLWFVLQWAYTSGVAIPEAGSVAYLAHVIGFVAGIAVALVVRSATGPPTPPAYPASRRPPSSW